MCCVLDGKIHIFATAQGDGRYQTWRQGLNSTLLGELLLGIRWTRRRRFRNQATPSIGALRSGTWRGFVYRDF